MNWALRRVWQRVIEVRGSDREGPRGTGRSEYVLRGVGIPLIALVVAVSLTLGAFSILKGSFIHTSAGDQPSTVSQSDSAALPASEIDWKPLSQSDAVAAAVTETEGAPSSAGAAATPAAAIETAPPSAGIVETPTAEVEPEPPLIQYLADPAKIEGGIWVEVSLTRQTMVIFKGKTPIFRSRVSTGQPGFETPIGVYYVERMLQHDDMDGQFLGEDYYYPDVPNVMYFTDRGHALHGVYWHDDFGTPLSHGCVGMPPEAAAYLFGMAYVGMGMEIFY